MTLIKYHVDIHSNLPNVNKNTDRRDSRKRRQSLLGTKAALSEVYFNAQSSQEMVCKY